MYALSAESHGIWAGFQFIHHAIGSKTYMFLRAYADSLLEFYTQIVCILQFLLLYLQSSLVIRLQRYAKYLNNGTKRVNNLLEMRNI